MKLTVNNVLMSFIVPRKATDSNSRTISFCLPCKIVVKYFLEMFGWSD